jgi:hypothetical protein
MHTIGVHLRRKFHVVVYDEAHTVLPTQHPEALGLQEPEGEVEILTPILKG